MKAAIVSSVRGRLAGTHLPEREREMSFWCYKSQRLLVGFLAETSPFRRTLPRRPELHSAAAEYVHSALSHTHAKLDHHHESDRCVRVIVNPLEITRDHTPPICDIDRCGSAHAYDSWLRPIRIHDR